MNNASTQVFEERVDWHFCPSALSSATLPLSLCWTTMIRHHFVSLRASKLACSISPWLLAKCLDQRDFIYLSQIRIFHCLSISFLPNGCLPADSQRLSWICSTDPTFQDSLLLRRRYSEYLWTFIIYSHKTLSHLHNNTKGFIPYQQSSNPQP